MNHYKLYLLILCLGYTLTASSQAKKTTTPAKSTLKPVSSVDEGALDPKDYGYYFLVSRSSRENANYLLKDRSNRPAATSEFSTPLIVIDSRTMKELAWWPAMKITNKQGYLYGYTADDKGALLAKITDKGKLLYAKKLTWKTPTGETEDLFKSSDDQHVFTVYNNDVWVGDFDISTGTSSNIHQVTQNGLMRLTFTDYMRNNILLMGEYVVNTTDGQYAKSGMVDYILSDSNPYYHVSNYPTQTSIMFSLLYCFNGWKQVYALSKPGESPRHWINREQTKILWSKNEPDGQESFFIHTRLDPNKYPSPGKIDKVTWRDCSLPEPYKLWGPNLERSISPNSKYFFVPSIDRNTDAPIFHVYNLETLAEYSLPIYLGGNLAEDLDIAWTDDTHLVFTLKAGQLHPNMLDARTMVTTENQGTYILDVETKQMKRLTPYILETYDRNFARSLDLKTFMFEANNYIFRCNSDGSELTQMTKVPGIYKIAGSFLK